MRNIHVIVATGEWGQDELRYRRHRLADFLNERADTKEVIWLCPTPNQNRTTHITLSNGINQWYISDLFSQKFFRFARYRDRFYQDKLQPLLLYLKWRQSKYKIYLWYTFPGFPLLADLFPWNKVVYDCSDLWASSIKGKRSIFSTIRHTIISEAENRIIHKANLIFCTSEFLRNQVVGRLGSDKKVYIFENGVEYDLFAREYSSPENIFPAGFDGTVLGYIGGIKPKLDFELIGRIAKQKPEWLIFLVGPDGTNNQQEFKQLLKEKNVIWTGSVYPHDVPKYMQLVDIGIMPYKPSEYNKAVFPLKLFEFLAAGKPVVGIHLPSTKKYEQEGVYSYLETSNDQEFIHACEQLVASKKQDIYIEKRKQMAKKKNWKYVFEEMVHLL